MCWYLNGNFFPIERALHSHFDVTWRLTIKLFPAKISERATLQNPFTSEGNSHYVFTGELIVKQRRFWATQVDRKWTCFILGQVSSFQVDSLLARTFMVITHYTYVRLHHWLKLVEGKVENLPRQCFQSLLLDTRLVIANSFPSGTNGILILKNTVFVYWENS